VSHANAPETWALIKFGAKVVSDGRYFAFQLAEVVVPRELFEGISER